MKKTSKNRDYTAKRKEFTENQVLRIRELHATGISISALAKKYNSRWLYIKDAIEGVTHKKIKKGQMKANINNGNKTKGKKVNLNDFEFIAGDIKGKDILKVIKMRLEKGMSKHEISVKMKMNYDEVALIVDSFTVAKDGKYSLAA